MFVRDGTAWSREALLTVRVKEGAFRFGEQVAIDAAGTRLVAKAGARAYVYVRTGSTWTREATLDAGAEAHGSVSVDAAGTRVLISLEQGATAVFNRRKRRWRRDATLTTSSGWGMAALSGDGDVAIVGVPDLPDPGHALVFRRANAGWAP